MTDETVGGGHAEAVLREIEDKFRLLSASIHEGFALHETIDNERGEAIDYRTLEVNAAYAEMLGFPREQLVGQTASALYGDGVGAHLDIYARVVASGQPACFETVITATQKSVRIWVSSGGARRFVTIVEDTTAYKRLEQQFHQAQKMEAMGHLASGIAHDFNNLLMVILGYSDMVMARVGDHPDVVAGLQEIKNAGEQAGRLSRQVLAFSRKQQLVPRVLDLNQVIAELDKMLSRVIGDSVRLEKTFASSLAHIKADAGQIEQILMNLAVNARDAMPKGGTLAIATAEVTLSEAFARRHPGTAAGRFVSLTVRDTGGGMPPEVVARAFEPFFTTKGPAKGTGLGLSTVHRIVRESSGYITVESVQGTGTTFTIYFPPVDAPVDVVQPEPLEGTKTPLLIEFSRMK